ncbi:SH3 domain and tetratricopeptide repeat-containing protein 1 isoform X2 [Stigmatopora argus]
MDKIGRHDKLGSVFSGDGWTDLKRRSEEKHHLTALPVRLDVVTGVERLPASEPLQEMLRGKLRIQQAHSAPLAALLMEASSHLVAIDSEDQVIFLSFKTLEEVWKFTTYDALGLLGHFMERLLFDPKTWLLASEEHLGINVSVPQDQFPLLYTRVLLREGSLFARCATSQMFDGRTSGGDLHLEPGDVALFQPPLLDSGWTVLRLADGARGTAAEPALEPLAPFHQWFLKSCAESVLLGDGMSTWDFPLHFATGTCSVKTQYDAESPDELSLVPGDSVAVVGRLVSCHGWFLGEKEDTKEVGLVRTSQVEPSSDAHDSGDVLLHEEELSFVALREDHVLEEALTLLQRMSQRQTGSNYKLDVFGLQDSEWTQWREPPTTLEPAVEENTERAGPRTREGATDSAEDRPANLDPRFDFHPPEDGQLLENVSSLLSLLEARDFREHFRVLYTQSPKLLSSSVFGGRWREDELISFLSTARETARKKGFSWAQTRLCFLLGKFCATQTKLSQARVYFEEALGVPRITFEDLRLLAGIYSELAAIYLLQKNAESFYGAAQRLVALLMGTPYCLECVGESWVLEYALKKAIVSQNVMAEARACYLLAMHHWTREERRKAVPYLERFLVLGAGAQSKVSCGEVSLTLARLCKEAGLPYLSVSSAGKAWRHPSATLTHCLASLLLVLDPATGKESFPAHLAPCLHRCLSLTDSQAAPRHTSALKRHLTVCLSWLFSQHGMLGRAVRLMRLLVDGAPSPTTAEGRESSLVWLAWLHIRDGQPTVGLRVLDSVLADLPERRATPLQGLVLNMRGVALRGTGDLRGASQSYLAAADVCQSHRDVPNLAVVHANLGLLCLKAGAKRLAREHLTKAVRLFSARAEGYETSFVATLLELGQQCVNQRQVHYGKGCYEWALLLAINSELHECQLSALGHLCHLYERESPDQAHRLIYGLRRVRLLQATPDREQEGEALESVSQLFLSLATHGAYRTALEHTKSSLAIFIDLGHREKEAYGWLRAAKIYHLLGQVELVDLYVQLKTSL